MILSKPLRFCVFRATPNGAGERSISPLVSPWGCGEASTSQLLEHAAVVAVALRYEKKRSVGIIQGVWSAALDRYTHLR
jgi:hypothetical protein